MLPEYVREVAERTLGGVILGASPVGGGCISNATQVQTEHERVFLKWTPKSESPLLYAEVTGLRALSAVEADLIIPRVRFITERDAPNGVLILDWINSGNPRPGFWAAFANGLASLHRHTAPAYGFDEDNFIGRTPQANGWRSTWPEFFLEQRLDPQARLARSNGRWRKAWDGPFDQLTRRLGDLLPEKPPASMLHGDLWSGNFMVSSEGIAALIDPAVYFGDRETDLALSRLFGGFAPDFYASYEENWPLEAGADDRIPIYNLYHVLNHLNLFGESYSGSVDSILSRFR